jgi:predicted phosphodiesterase
MSNVEVSNWSAEADPAGVVPYNGGMRLLVTADLHYNHPKSKRLAEEIIDGMNRVHADVLLVVGDTAVADGDHLERCLERFRFAGPKLFVAGNHELWTRGEDSYWLFTDELPRRVREMGWRWLEGDPFVRDGVAVVGTIGWYDYSYAEEGLGIPRRFYEQKVSPGAAEVEGGFAQLFERADDISAHAREVFARWNDARFVKLQRPDAAFLDELLTRLEGQLDALVDVPHVVAAVHHVPFRELLPPRHNAQWDFARAYLGADRLGEMLLRHENVKTVFCGHSHHAAEAEVGGVRAINIGSGYRVKKYRVVEVP